MIYGGTPDDVYQAHAGLNCSTLKRFARAAALVGVKEESPAFLPGRAFHTAVLEPARFDLRYVTWAGDKRDRRVKAWADFEDAAKATGREVLNTEEYDTAWAMAEAVRKEAGDYFEEGDSEVMAVATIAGRLLKCRGDFLNNTKGVIELKGMANAEPEAFDKSAWDLKYIMAAGFYTDVFAAALEVEPDDVPYVFVVCEKTAPFLVSVRPVPKDVIAEGRRQYQELLVRYLECEAKDEWPGYGTVPMRLPRWMRRNQGEWTW